ncbi:MAG: dynamin family protein [Clostridiales bacterium]|nr:dynamin family protein [Clostridiales bacterium]
MNITKNQYKAEFDKLKDKVLDILNEAKDYYDKWEITDKAEAFNVHIENLKNNEFSIVVVGEFSAGKSTFLNALMGERILPSFSSETTATINFLKDKSKAPNGTEAVVYFKDGHTKEFKKADYSVLEKYLTKNDEINVAKEIEKVDYYLDSKFLKEGVMLVDSPGLNGNEEGHKEMTEAQIEKSSASIFMFRAEQPGSKSDFEFLSNLKKKVNTIIFVLNKIDEIKASENQTVETVIETLKKNYKKYFPDEKTIPEIIGIAAYPALVARSSKELEYERKKVHTPEEKAEYLKLSRFQIFEDRLWKFLTQGEKAKSMLVEPVDKTLNFLKEEKDKNEEFISYLDNNNSKEDIDDQIEEIEAKERDIRKQLDATALEIGQDIKNITDDIKGEIKDKMDAFKKRQNSIIDSWTTIDDYEEYVESINSTIKRQTEIIMEEAAEEMGNQAENLMLDKYNNIMSTIDIPNVKFNNIENVFSLSADSFKSNMEWYEEEMKKRRAELNALNSKADEAELSLMEKRNNERKKKKLEANITSLQNEKLTFESAALPEKRYYKVNVEVEEGGIKGWFRSIWTGSSYVTREIEKDNSDEIEAAKAEHKRKADARQAEIDKINNEIEKYGDVEGASLSEQMRIKRLNAQLKEKKAEMEAFKTKFFDDFKENQTRFIRKMKYNVEDSIGDASRDIVKNVENGIKEYKNSLANAMSKVVSAKLNEELERKRIEKERLRKGLDDSIAELENKREKCNKRIEAVNKILADAAGIKALLESRSVDSVVKDL